MGHLHSFAVVETCVSGWRLNQSSQCGVSAAEDITGEDDSFIQYPIIIKSLAPYNIVQIASGEHHSLALTGDGQLLMWGRNDNHELALDLFILPDADVVRGVDVKIRRGLHKPHVLRVEHT